MVILGGVGVSYERGTPISCVMRTKLLLASCLGPLSENDLHSLRGVQLVPGKYDPSPKYSTYKTVKARLWPQLSRQSP